MGTKGQHATPRPQYKILYQLPNPRCVIFSILSLYRLVMPFIHSILQLCNVAVIVRCYGQVGTYLGLNYSSEHCEGGSSLLSATHRYFTSCHVWTRRVNWLPHFASQQNVCTQPRLLSETSEQKPVPRKLYHLFCSGTALTVFINFAICSLRTGVYS